MKPSKTLSDTALYNYQQKLNGIFEYAKDNDLMAKNPITDRVRLPKQKSNRTVFDLDELTQLPQLEVFLTFFDPLSESDHR